MNFEELYNQEHKKYIDLQEEYKRSCEDYERRIIRLYNFKGLDLIDERLAKISSLVEELNNEILSEKTRRIHELLQIYRDQLILHRGGRDNG